MKEKNRVRKFQNIKAQLDVQFEELLREATKLTVEKKAKAEADRTWQEHNERLNVWTNGTYDEA